MARTRVRWGRIGALAAAMVMSVSLLAGRAGAGGGSVVSHHSISRNYVVRPGDTLWSIATRVVGPRGDPRPMVDRLALINHVHQGVIHVGDVLAVQAG